MLTEVLLPIADAVTGLKDGVFFWLMWYLIIVLCIKVSFAIIADAGDKQLANLPRIDYEQYFEVVDETYRIPDDGGLPCNVKFGDGGHQISTHFTSNFKKPSLGVGAKLFTIYEAIEENITNIDIMYGTVNTDGHKGQVSDEPIYEEVSSDEPIYDIPEENNVDDNDEEHFFDYEMDDLILELPRPPGTTLTKRRRMIKTLRNLFCCLKSKTND